MEIQKIIKEFKRIRKEEDLQIIDEVLFEQAIDVFISMGIQKGYKDIGKQESNTTDNLKQESKPSGSKKENKNSFGKPTEKMQYYLEKAWKIPDGKEYLKELGFDGNFDLLTFDKAKELISKVKSKEGY